MEVARKAEAPEVLSYQALRTAVGGVALGLPFALAIPWWLVCKRTIETSISAYYHTGMRNLFVGSLCAIAMFMLCTRGYDHKDEMAGVFSAICALGVAFFPVKPDVGASSLKDHISIVHYTFATSLFLTLAYFCLVLFRMTAANRRLTSQKLKRNRVYTVCGYLIIASVLLIAVLKLLKFLGVVHTDYLFGCVGWTFCLESTALFAFGIAWLTKGETFLKDQVAPTDSAFRSLQ